MVGRRGNMYNIAKADGTLMLLKWVHTRRQAENFLAYFKTKYAAGKRYPNGKGVYPDWGFRIVFKPDSYPEAQKQLDTIFYALGLLPPRYPMPALLSEVDLARDFRDGLLYAMTYGTSDG